MNDIKIKRPHATTLSSYNKRAINFYKKNGFVEFDKHMFRLDDDEQTDIMMRLNLKDSTA